MSEFVTSADGTRIAYDRVGSGPAVIHVAGATAFRATDHEIGVLADALKDRFTVISYDRRGRGESTDTAPYAREREFDDLRALIAANGGLPRSTPSPRGRSSPSKLRRRAFPSTVSSPTSPRSARTWARSMSRASIALSLPATATVRSRSSCAMGWVSRPTRSPA
jgi:hypothetical protein